LPSKESISTVIEPSYSVRVTRRPPCSQVTSRPCRSRVLPLAKFDGLRKLLYERVKALHIARYPYESDLLFKDDYFEGGV